MAEDVRISYRLPLSAIRFTGETQYTEDTILAPGVEVPSYSAEIALETIADTSSSWVAKVDREFLQDTKISFDLTEDRRLVTGAVDTTGQAGKVLIGVVGVGASIAGIALGLPPVAASGLLAAAGLAAEDTRARKKPTPDEKVAQEYAKRFSVILALREKYAELVSSVSEEIAKVGSEIASAKSSTKRADLLHQLRALQKVLGLAREELDRLDEHFKAWRASTKVTRKEKHDYLLDLNSIVIAGTRVVDGALSFPRIPADDPGKDRIKQAQARVQMVWDRLGAVVTLGDAEANGSQARAPEQAAAGGEIEGVQVRSPRRVTLGLWTKDDAGKAVKIQTKSYLVMDAACSQSTMKWDESWFGNRTLKLGFSPNGALTSLSTESTSDAAVIAETAAALPATITGGLEQSSKLLDQIEALRTKSTDQRLARLKKDIELKQQQILQTGLAATEGSHAELERLKQEAAILEARETIRGGTDPTSLEIAELKRQVELLKARKDVADAERALSDGADDLRAELMGLVEAAVANERRSEPASSGRTQRRRPAAKSQKRR